MDFTVLNFSTKTSNKKYISINYFCTIISYRYLKDCCRDYNVMPACIDIEHKTESCRAISLWWKEPKFRNNINPGLESLSAETTEQ